MLIETSGIWLRVRMQRNLREEKLRDQDECENEICGWQTVDCENGREDQELPTITHFVSMIGTTLEPLLPFIGSPSRTEPTSVGKASLGLQEITSAESKATSDETELMPHRSNSRHKHSDPRSLLHNGMFQVEHPAQRQQLRTITLSVTEKSQTEQTQDFREKRRGKKGCPVDQRFMLEPATISYTSLTQKLGYQELERTFQLPRIVDTMETYDHEQRNHRYLKANRKQPPSRLNQAKSDIFPTLMYQTPARQLIPTVSPTHAKPLLLCRNDRVWLPKMKTV